MLFRGSKVNRALSVFDHAHRRWAAIPLRDQLVPIAQKQPSRPANAHAVYKQSLALTTWNVQASESKPVALSPVTRFEPILDRILKGPNVPDIIFLQEVASSVREYLPSDSRVRSSFLTTDAENDSAFQKVPFATMTLLSNKRFISPSLSEKDGVERKGEEGSKVVVDNVFRMELPSRYERDVLCVDIRHPAVPGAILRLLNVHLDSLHSPLRRMFQMDALAELLREHGCKGGVVAGDFNAIHPNDYTLVKKHGLIDAWETLRGSKDGPDGGATWGVGVELEDGLQPGRLDKVIMLGLKPDKIEILQPGFIGGNTPWSDHCGLHCSFTVSDDVDK